MPQIAPEIEKDSRYSSNLEYLCDELKRLDLVIRLKLLEQEGPVASTDRFKGLLLSKEEIAELISDRVPEENTENRSEKQTITNSLESLKSQIEKKRASSLKAGVYLALPHIAEIFDLTAFETEFLLVCLAPEIDRKYDGLFAYLQNDVTRKKPSVDLLLNLACPTLDERLGARDAFDPRAPLLKYRLLEMTESPFDGPVSLLSRSAKLDDRAASFLLGSQQLDAQLDGIARIFSPQNSSQPLPVDKDTRNSINDFIRSQFYRTNGAARSLIFFFCGPYGAGRRSLAKAVCRDLNLRLIVGNLRSMLDSELPFDEMVWRLGREAALQNAVVCLEEFDSLLEGEKGQKSLRSLVEMIDSLPRLFFLISTKNWNPRGQFGEGAFVDLDFPVPDEEERKRIWEESLQTGGLPAEGCDAGQLASSFKLTAGQIRDALIVAQTRARWRSSEAFSSEAFSSEGHLSEDARITMRDLSEACHAQGDLRLGALARKIEPAYGWDDIVLPPDQMEQLGELCDQARNRHTVYNNWGFGSKLSLGKGLTALFSGPPGTGKTMAAEVIATQLQLDLYKIDLSQIVSKYIGETEKNLHQVFNGAQSSGAILFFDEADALFGKRSEVKDSHDRYANIEVGYLLQKMDEYDGVAILATNLRQNMDAAFARRMRFIIEFPFPDEQYRRRIWRAVFPAEAPVALDDDDFARLAREVGLAGGNIRNIALAAAFVAASENARIQMSHVLKAARREHQKLGRV